MTILVTTNERQFDGNAYAQCNSKVKTAFSSQGHLLAALDCVELTLHNNTHAQWPGYARPPDGILLQESLIQALAHFVVFKH